MYELKCCALYILFHILSELSLSFCQGIVPDKDVNREMRYMVSIPPEHSRDSPRPHLHSSSHQFIQMGALMHSQTGIPCFVSVLQQHIQYLCSLFTIFRLASIHSLHNISYFIARAHSSTVLDCLKVRCVIFSGM